MKFKIEGVLAWFIGQEEKSSVVTNNFVDDDGGGRSSFGSGGYTFFVVIARGNGEDHIPDSDTADMFDRAEKAHESSVEGKFTNANHRWNIGAIVVVNGQSLAANTHQRPYVNVQGIQFDLAVETLAEFANHPNARVFIEVA